MSLEQKGSVRFTLTTGKNKRINLAPLTILLCPILQHIPRVSPR